jgi:hypothetical protein
VEHVSPETRDHGITEETFSVRYVPGLYNENKAKGLKLARVEPGSNTSIVDLRVVGGDEKGTSAWGYNWATLFLRDISTVTWLSRLGESRM